MTFTFSPTLSASGDTITISFGDSTQATVSYPCPLGACGATHSYSAGGTYTVTATGTAGGAAVSGSTSVVVSGGGGGGALTITANPSERHGRPDRDVHVLADALDGRGRDHHQLR